MTIYNFRFDPWTGTPQPVDINDERHTIPASSPYTIKLLEVPQKNAPTTTAIRIVDSLTAAIASAGATTITVAHGAWFALNDVITIDNEKLQVTAAPSGNTLTVSRGYDGTTASTHSNGASVFIENSMVEVSAAPSENQFWPDYNVILADFPRWNTGTILVNSAAAGKTVSVNYKAMGHLVDDRILDQRFQLYTSSGTWRVPPGVTKVLVTGCGGGGGGGRGYPGGWTGPAGGGGGAGAVALDRLIEGIIPGSTISITIGSGGASQSNGGATTFGSYLTLAGGVSGGNGTVDTPGAAGTSSGMRLVSTSGTAGDSVHGGVGGSTLFGDGGSGGAGDHQGIAGSNGSGYGAGGGGGGAGTQGGSGSPGFLLLKW